MDESAVVSPPSLAGPLALHPFRALHLAPSRVGTAAGARAFAAPHAEVPGRVAAWCRDGVAVQETRAALWVHEYTARGMTVRGLVGTLDLTHLAEPGGPAAVLPHERVLPDQVDELEHRMGTMQLQPAPILLAHRGHPTLRGTLDTVAAGEPTLRIQDPTGQQHRAWALDDPRILEELGSGLASGTALIADGHHRYAAYLRLSQSAGGTGPWSRGLAMLVDHGDTPLFLGAIHRMLRGVSLAELLAAADDIGCRVRHGTRTQAVAALERHTLVLVTRDGAAWVESPRTTLPVELLHHELLPALERRHGRPTEVDHLHTADRALAGADAARGVAVLLPALELDEVMQVLRRGDLLPEKATSFQPKPSVGVLMRPVHDAAAARP